MLSTPRLSNPSFWLHVPYHLDKIERRFHMCVFVYIIYPWIRTYYIYTDSSPLKHSMLIQERNQQTVSSKPNVSFQTKLFFNKVKVFISIKNHVIFEEITPETYYRIWFFFIGYSFNLNNHTNSLICYVFIEKRISLHLLHHCSIIFI